MRRRVCSGRRASVFSRRLFGEATFEQGFALRRFAGNARFGAVVCSLRHSSGKTRIVFGLTGRLQIIRSFPASAKVGRNSGVPGLMRIRYAIFAVLRIPSRGNRACRLLPEPAVRSLRRGPETAIPSFTARRNKGRVFAAAAFAASCSARIFSVAVLFTWIAQRAIFILLRSAPVSMIKESSLTVTTRPMMPPMVVISSPTCVLSRIS